MKGGLMKLGYKVLMVGVVALVFAGILCINGKNDIAVSAPSNVEEISINAEIDESLNLYVATDIHYLSSRVNDKGVAFQKMVDSGDGRQLNYSEEIVEAFTYNIIEQNPEILIISGDLTHNGEKASHEDMAKRLQEIEDSGTQVLVIPGNHDINNPWARAFVGENQEFTENVTPEEFENIYKNFGYREFISRDEESLSYLAEANEKVWVLMLDTSRYENNSEHPVTNGRLKEHTLEWIKECSVLAKENNVQLVTAMHHNLYNHSDLLNLGFTIDNNTEVYETFVEAGINFILSGHIHIQDIKVDKENKVYDIATSVLIGYPQQYGMIAYDNEKGFNYTTEKVDVEKWAKDTGSVDENLLNFSTYSRDYFYDRSYNQTYSQLITSGDYTEGETKSMSDVMATLNVNYFAGTANQVCEEVRSSEGYKLWEIKGQKFIKSYIIKMAEVTQDFNSVTIPIQVR